MNDAATAEGRPPPDGQSPDKQPLEEQSLEEQPPTLGQLLDVQARRRAQALHPRLAWARPLATVMRKAEELGGGVGGRFDRFEGRSFADPGSSAPTVAALVRRPGAAPRHTDTGPAAPAADDHPRGAGATTTPKPPTGDGGGGERPELRELPPSTRYRLRQEVGAAADAMRVHDGPRADALARAADADAVTVGREVYLRQGRYAPHRRDGLALLAHEATHVAAVLEPGRAWRRAVGDDAEERVAREREARMLGGAPIPRSSPPVIAPPGPAPVVGPPGPPGPTAAPPVATSAPPRAPRAAPTDRDLAASPAAPLDLDALRRSVLADVMRQIKTESERGG